MVQYIFAEAVLPIKEALKADPNVVGAELAKLANENGGKLTPKSVVEAARNKRHVLHKHFEWDDAIAAESYRLDQARTLIRVVRVVEEDSTEPVQAFLSVRDRSGTGYRSLDAVRSSAEFQVDLLRQAKRDLEAFRKRYRTIVDICEIVSQAEQAIDKKLGNIETRAAA